MSNLQILAGLLATPGVIALVTQVVSGIAKWKSGEQDRERDQARWMIEQRDQAESRARAADRTSNRLRRERDAWRELAMRHRMALIEAGKDPGELPTCPDD